MPASEYPVIKVTVRGCGRRLSHPEHVDYTARYGWRWCQGKGRGTPKKSGA